MSANVGATWPADLDLRMVKIKLFLPEENPNARKFGHSTCISGPRKPRRTFSTSRLGKQMGSGRPDGPTPFASFPEWVML